MSEFAPPGRKVKMTKAQVKKYVADMKKAQQEALAKLEAAKKAGELDTSQTELDTIEDQIEMAFLEDDIDNLPT